MHEQPSFEVSAREPLRRVASALALVAVSLGTVGGAIVRFDVVTRPPCEPGYVRLVDFEPVGVMVSFALAGLSLVVYWRSRRGTHLEMIAGMGVVVLVGVALVDFGAVATLVHHHGARYDSSCWTF